MKKVLLVFTTVLLIIGLAACGGYAEENHAPLIYGARNYTVLVGDAVPDYLNGVTAEDQEDGDITSKLVVNDDNVNYDQIGVYDVTISITDNDGEITYEMITLTVEDPDSTNTVPRFAGLDLIYILVIGDSFNPFDDLSFKVIDNEDLDIANSLIGFDEVSCTYDGTDCSTDGYVFNATALGDYFFNLSVEDSEGASGNGTVIVRVIDSFDNPRNERVDSVDQRFNGVNTLVVGSYEPTGNFISGFFGNAYDGNITGLLYGMNTIVTDKDGEMVYNMTILEEEPTITYSETYTYEDYDQETKSVFNRDVQDVTYTFTIKDDLRFSDGTAVRASDFKFSAKLLSSYAYGKVGATTAAYSEIVGYEEWNEGCILEKDSSDNFVYYLPSNITETSDEDLYSRVAVHKDERITFEIGGQTKVFKAVTRCSSDVESFDQSTLDFTGIVANNEDNTISITVKGDELPYFFLESLVSISPLSEQAYTQGGAYGFDVPAADNGSVVEHVGEYVKDFLKSDPPAVTGPYELIEYVDGVYAKLAVNIHFPGDYTGQKPSIDTIVIRFIESKNEENNIIVGDIDLLVNVVEANKIDELNLVEHTTTTTAARNGYGMLSFHTDMPIVNDVRVRQAIMYLLDREGFVDNFLGDYGYVVDAPYGRSQWMYDASSLFDASDNRLNHYDYNLAKAIELLEEAGWIYGGANQEDYNGGVRYNADGDMLQINWLATQTDFTNNLKLFITGDNGFSEAGMIIEYTEGQFNDLLDEYYYAYKQDPSERTYHMFNLATGIGVNYDPYYSFHSDWFGTQFNINQYNNAEADLIIEAMRELDPNDPDSRDEYLVQWENFMIHVNENLPFIPIYSNVYHTYSNHSLRGFEVSPTWAWTQAIIYCEIDDELGN